MSEFESSRPRDLPDQYRLGSRLSRGSTKDVYAAYDEILGREVAIAVIEDPPHPVRDALAREFRTIGPLTSLPGILPIYHSIFGERSVIVVSKLVRQGSLERRILDPNSDPLDFSWRVETAVSICKALQVAHMHGVVHGDLKPANILVESPSTIYLCDFGWAQIEQQYASDLQDMSVATPAFAAPECIRGTAADPMSDLYSLGCVLWQLFTGRPPFEGNAASVLLSHLTERPVLAASNALWPPGLPDILLRLLDKIPLRRARLTEVIAALSSSTRTTSTADSSRPPLKSGHAPRRIFVGRSEELREIHIAFDAALQGTPSIVTVTGEAGIGKTALISELLDRWSRAGGLGVRGECKSAADPFVAVVELAERMLVALPVEQSTDVVRAFASGASLNLRVDDRASLWQSLSRWIQRLAGRIPLLIVLEDLQDADAGTVEFVRTLVEEAATTRELYYLCVLLTSRTDLRSLFSTQESRRLTRIDVSRLSSIEVQAWLTAQGCGRASSQLANILCQRTLGNPLHLTQLFGKLRAAGTIGATRDGRLKIDESIATSFAPEDLAGTIDARVDRLPIEAKRCVMFASCLGEYSAFEELAATLGISTSQLAIPIDNCVQANLLSLEGSGVRFTHAIVRETVYSRASPLRRSNMHEHVASRLCAFYGRDQDLHATTIAYHLIRSARDRSSERLGRFARIAASQAESRLAFEDAAHWLEATIQITTQTPLTRGDLHVEIAQLFHVARNREASRAHIELAKREFTDIGDFVRLTKLATMELTHSTNYGEVAHGQMPNVAELEALVAKLPNTEHRVADVANLWIAHAMINARQLDRAGALLRPIAEAASNRGDDFVLSEIATSRSMIHLERLELVQAHHVWREGIGQARRARNNKAEFDCIERLPYPLFLSGDFAGAMKWIEESTRFEGAGFGSRFQALSKTIEASIALAHGDFARAGHTLSDVVAIIKETSYPWAATTAIPALVTVHALQGEWVEARSVLRLLSENGNVFSDVRPYHGLVERSSLLLRALENSALALSEAPDPPLQPPIRRTDLPSLMRLVTFTEIADTLERPELVQDASHWLVAAIDAGVRVTCGWVCSLERLAGVAFMMEGNYLRATEYLDRAIETTRNLGMHAEYARTRFDRARLSVRQHGVTRDSDAEIDEVATEFDQLGVRAYAQIARRLLAVLGESRKRT